MNKYYECVEGLQKLLKNRKVCRSSCKSHETCYMEFGRYLETEKNHYHMKLLDSG